MLRRPVKLSPGLITIYNTNKISVLAVHLKRCNLARCSGWQFTLTSVAAMLTHGMATVFKHFSWTMMLQTGKETVIASLNGCIIEKPNMKMSVQSYKTIPA